MLEKVKENWQEFKESEPGHRFQERYERRQKESHGRLNAGKLLNIVGGLVIAAAGVFFIPAPGPGSMIIFVGLGLIGSEFLPLARFLDWAEVRLRDLAGKANEFWAHASLPLKILIGALLLAVAAALAYGAYLLFFAGSGGSPGQGSSPSR